MLTKIFDLILEVLVILRQALLIYIHRNRAVKILLTHAVVDGVEIITQPEEKMQLSDIQKATFVVGPNDIVDVKGNPAPIDGAISWASSDLTIITVNQSADGLSCEVVAAGALGHAQVNASADADLGAGVVTITGTKEIDVVASQAVAINIADVAPVDQ